MVPFDDEMIISKPAIIFHSGQIFFNFLAMICFASVASFQASWGVGPSGLTGFALFTSIAGMFLSAFLLLVPVCNEKYDKLVRLARALKEVRIGFILTTAGTAFSLLIAFVVTISAWTQPGCKDPNQDPNAKVKGTGFKKGLDGFCSSKKAGAVFLWLAFGFWLCSFILLIHDWRSGKLFVSSRDPPFSIPEAHDVDEGDEETIYRPQGKPVSVPQARYDPSATISDPFTDTNRNSHATMYSPTPNPVTAHAIPAARPSIDVYGAFSDPAPSGFGTSSPVRQNPVEPPRISRTMQYADPYSAVRSSVGGQYSPTIPPTYESGHTGYR